MGRPKHQNKRKRKRVKLIVPTGVSIPLRHPGGGSIIDYFKIVKVGPYKSRITWRGNGWPNHPKHHTVKNETLNRWFGWLNGLEKAQILNRRRK